MDYAHVLRKSYSRPQDSRTTDQLVIADAGSGTRELHGIKSSAASMLLSLRPAAVSMKHKNHPTALMLQKVASARSGMGSQHSGGTGVRFHLDENFDNNNVMVDSPQKGSGMTSAKRLLSQGGFGYVHQAQQR